MSSHPTKREQQRAATAQRLYEAALNLFAAQGYDATTVEAIAGAAGVAKGTFFVHFPSKEAVLGHLGRLQIERLDAALVASDDLARMPIREQLRFVYRTLARGVDAQPDLARKLTLVLLRGEQAFDGELLSMDVLDRALQGLAAAAQARGELRTDVSAAEVAALVRGMYFLAIFDWVRRAGEPFAPLAERYLDLLLDGLV